MIEETESVIVNKEKKMENLKERNLPFEKTMPFGDGFSVMPDENKRNSLEKEIRRHIQEIEDQDRCIHFLMDRNHKLNGKIKKYRTRLADAKIETDELHLSSGEVQQKLEKLIHENKEAESLETNIHKMLKEEEKLKADIEKLENIRRILALKSDDVEGVMPEMFPSDAYGTGMSDIKSLRSQISVNKSLNSCSSNLRVMEVSPKRKGPHNRLRTFLARIFRRRK